MYAKLPRGTMEPGKAGHQVGPQLLCVDVQTIGHIDQLRTQLHRQQKKGRGSAAEAGFADQSLVQDLGTRPTQKSLGHTSRTSAGASLATLHSPSCSPDNPPPHRLPSIPIPINSAFPYSCLSSSKVGYTPLHVTQCHSFQSLWSKMFTAI